MTFSKQPVLLIEVGLNYCSNTFSVSPCTATGAAGTECYNTFKTCQDATNFNQITRWHRFVNANLVGLPPFRALDVSYGFADGDNTVPMASILNEPDVLPIKIDPARSLGDRGTITFAMADQPWNDLDLDPYVATRAYTPIDRGTYFGKLRARQYLEGRTIRVYTIDYDDSGELSLSGAVRRTYIVQKVDGPDQEGRVTVTGVDPLALALKTKAELPAPSAGTLSTALIASGSDNLVTVTNAEDYPATGKIRVNNEVMTYARTGGSFSLTRGQSNTVIESHSIGDTAQLVEQFNDQIWNVLTTMLEATSAEAAWIDTAGWQTALTPWRVEVLEFEVTKPTPVEDLIESVLVEHSCSLWWDEASEVFKMKPLIPEQNLTTIDESTGFIRDSFSREELPEERVSRVQVYYGQKDTTKDLDEESNWSIVEVVADANAESGQAYGTKGIRTIYARTISRTQKSLASTLASLIILTYRDDPFNIRWRLGADLAANYDLADVVKLDHWTLQDETGANLPTAVQIIEKREVEPLGEVEFTGIRYPLAGRFALYTADERGPFATASDEDKLTGAYYADDDGLMPDGSDGYGYYPG